MPQPGVGPGPTVTVPPAGQPYLQSTADPQLWAALDKEVVRVGRASENELVIDERYQGWQTVSQCHARFEWDGQRRRWLVVDEGSRNGVFVQGQRTGENVLRVGDHVRLGDVELEFHAPERGGY